MVHVKKSEHRFLSILLTIIMVFCLFMIFPASAQNAAITTPEGYIRIPERLMNQPKTEDLELLANEFLKQGYGVLVEVQAFRNETTLKDSYFAVFVPIGIRGATGAVGAQGIHPIHQGEMHDSIT